MSVPREHRHATMPELPSRESAALPTRRSTVEFTLDFVAGVYGTPLSTFDVDRARWDRLDDVVPCRVALHHLAAASDEAITAACLALMDHLPFAVVITDAAGRILLANRSALRAIQARDMVLSVDGAIAAVEPSARERLRAAIRSLCAPASRPQVPVVIVPLAKDTAWPHLIVIALESACETSCAAVIFPDRTRLNGAAQMVASLFALTPAQTRLALLVLEGHSSSEAASVLHITPRTALETWKVVRSKLRTRTDEECLRLLHAAIVAIDARQT
jgi:DNA-binding CsgD family transcriptional regulator